MSDAVVSELRERLEMGRSLLQSFQYSMNTLIYLSFDKMDDLYDTILSLGCSIFRARKGALYFAEDGGVPRRRASLGLEAWDPDDGAEAKGLLVAALEERVPLAVRSWEDSPDLKDLVRPPFVEPPFVLTSIDIHDTPQGLVFLEPGEDVDLRHVDPTYFKLFCGMAATSITNNQALMRAKALVLKNQEQRDELEEKNRTLLSSTEELRGSLETIQVQQEEIQRLSTPVVTIWDEVLCLPLIGMLDSQRAQQAMEVLLEKIIQEKARIVIVDITGVPLVDTLVANHLAQTMAAVRLIGAEGILTGISAGVAQTLVRMGVDISEINSRRSLADGLKLAVRILKKADSL